METLSKNVSSLSKESVSTTDGTTELGDETFKTQVETIVKNVVCHEPLVAINKVVEDMKLRIILLKIDI